MIDFTYRTYLDLLQYIQNLGYRIVCFRDIPRSGAYVILRHDVDFSLTKAVEMARIDHEAGLSSTFFFLLTSPYYNALSHMGRVHMSEILALGHEVGLHYDCDGFDRLSSEQRQRRISSQVACLEETLGVQVKAIAQHKPGQSPFREEFSSYLDAYSPPYFEDIAYVSDSRMMFRVPDLRAFLRHNPRTQMVIHPIWWNAEQRTRAYIFEALSCAIHAPIRESLQTELGAMEEFLKAFAASACNKNRP